MAVISIGKETIELAIQIERNGREFYHTLAGSSRDKEVREVFKRLALMEQEHENIFRDLLIRLGGYHPAQIHPGEHFQYIKGLADSTLFTRERARMALNRIVATDIEAFEIGIGFEKDSILLYEEIMGLMPPQDRTILEIVISEEKKHLSELAYQASRLRG